MALCGRQKTTIRRILFHARAGRPGILLELNPDALCFLGAEIGVEHISTVQIDLAGNIVRSSVEPFDGFSVGVDEAIDRAVEQAFRDLPAGARERCAGFGLSSPSQMSGDGVVRVAPLLGWRDVNPAERMRAVLPTGIPVMAENDANAFAIGATYRMRSAPSGVVLFLVIESGVGGGIVIDGKLFRGSHGLAGEIGHLRAPGGDGLMVEQSIGLQSVLAEYRALPGAPTPGWMTFCSRCVIGRRGQSRSPMDGPAFSLSRSFRRAA